MATRLTSGPVRTSDVREDVPGWPLQMNDPAVGGAPSLVAENLEKIIRVETEALRPRSRNEAITDSIGGFVGTLSFHVLQIVAFAGWVIVNAGIISPMPPFDPFPYPLLSSITSIEAVLLAALLLLTQNA